VSILGNCPCVDVRIELPRWPEWMAAPIAHCVADWPSGLLISARAGDDLGRDDSLCLGDRTIGIYLCLVCSCGTHWQKSEEDIGKMRVNAWLLDFFDETTVEVKKFDNAG